MDTPEKDRAQGKWEELKGKVKKNVGDLVDDESMEAEGMAEEHLGKAHQKGAEAAAQAEGAWQETKGKIKGAIGDLTDDETLEAEGKVDELKGEARQKTNW